MKHRMHSTCPSNEPSHWLISKINSPEYAWSVWSVWSTVYTDCVRLLIRSVIRPVNIAKLTHPDPLDLVHLACTSAGLAVPISNHALHFHFTKRRLREEHAFPRGGRVVDVLKSLMVETYIRRLILDVNQ